MRSLKMLLVSLFLFVAFSWSQTGTSTIRGTVTDPQGRVVPGATVTLTNVETNAVRSTKSNDTGSYVFDLITPAEYRLEVQAKGFKKQVVDKVQAAIGKATETNVALGVGAATEVVEVTSSSQEALINTQDAALGNAFNSLQITQLPLEAHNLVDLLSLQPMSPEPGPTSRISLWMAWISITLKTQTPTYPLPTTRFRLANSITTGRTSPPAPCFV